MRGEGEPGDEGRYSALASSRMHWKRDDRLTELGLGSPTCSLLSNDLRAVADSGERVWCILFFFFFFFFFYC